ncbi:MAG: GMC oxidoreductase [Planctomycetota bacterium]
MRANHRFHVGLVVLVVNLQSLAVGRENHSGVVDRDLRVHGTRNVYVCSSSAFPTSGQANPTFFLGMFAVRLAAMLSRQNA